MNCTYGVGGGFGAAKIVIIFFVLAIGRDFDWIIPEDEAEAFVNSNKFGMNGVESVATLTG